MGLRKLAFVILLVLAGLSAVTSDAWATATASKAQWYTGSSESSVSLLGGGQAATVELGEASGIGKEFRFRIEAVEGSPIVVGARKVSCAACTLSNEYPGHSGVATMTGKLTFSEAAVLSPPNCVVAGGQIATASLLFEADWMEGEKALTKIGPASGETLFSINLEDAQTGFCAYGGAHPVKGSNFAELGAKTGSFLTEQALKFSPAIAGAAGSSWIWGTKKVETTGVLKVRAGGKFFGVK